MAGLQSGEDQTMIVWAKYSNMTDIHAYRQPRRHSNSRPNAVCIEQHKLSQRKQTGGYNNIAKAASSGAIWQMRK